MSNLNNRLAKLETRRIAEQPTWKDIMTGKWQPSQKQWQAHLKQADIYQAARGWADTFTEDEAARVLSGDIDTALAEKLLTVPAELKPVLDELQTILTESLGDVLQEMRP